MSNVIAPMLSVYRTKQNLRVLLAKARAAVVVNEFTDKVVTIAGGASHTLTPSVGNALTILLPTALVNLTIANSTGSILLPGVDRMFVCPSNLTSITLVNPNALKPVDVQIISG